MNLDFLDFEQPIADLQAKIEQLHYVSAEEGAVDIVEEIDRLKAKCNDLTASIFKKLTAAQISQLARHPQRPYTFDYIDRIFDDYQQLHGDRAYADDKAIITGIAKLEGIPVMVIGHQKGRDTKDKIKRNFGMPRPEGYRKAKRVMELAAKFNLPVLTFIDTPGAYPGVGAEERGQSEAIAKNLYVMADLPTPMIATVIGEGGSGGALAIGIGDKVNMLQYSTYSVISPEGCATILWKSAKHASEAADAMGLTSTRLQELGLIDDIVEEPLGGAHRDYDTAAKNLKATLLAQLKELQAQNTDDLCTARYDKLMGFGNFDG